MLEMLPKLHTAVVTTVTALSIALGAAAPAAAWGQREQDTLKGAVGALVLKAIIDDARRDRAPIYHEPPAPVYRVVPDEPRYYHGHGHTKPKAQSIYHTPLAQAFNSYSRAERRLIQRRLAQGGYYRGGIDGSFGPGTYSAVVAYARDEGQGRNIGSTAGAFGVYDGLIY
jgi:hypothetical protein